MPNKKKKYNARFPPARIKKIMQKDEEVGKVAAAVPVIISRSLELFVESLIKKASEITQGRNAKTLTTTHLKQCILGENQFDFLKDLVASVPDVQGDDDSSNPPSIDILKPSIQPQFKKQRVRHRARKRNDAGPSQTTTESEDDDSDEDDDDDDEDEDDDDDSRSEDNSLPPKPIYLNNQGITNNVRVSPSPNGATSVIVSPMSFRPFTAVMTTTTTMPNTAHLDEDYDS